MNSVSAPCPWCNCWSRLLFKRILCSPWLWIGACPTLLFGCCWLKVSFLIRNKKSLQVAIISGEQSVWIEWMVWWPIFFNTHTHTIQRRRRRRCILNLFKFMHFSNYLFIYFKFTFACLFFNLSYLPPDSFWGAFLLKPCTYVDHYNKISEKMAQTVNAQSNK